MRRAVGIGRTAVRTRVADGRLRAVHSGVYAIAPLTQLGRWLAAVLAFSPNAVLSHRAGAELHGLVAPGSAIDVTVPRRARKRRGIRVHESRAIQPHDRTRIDGIPVTSIPRTLLDLAEILPPTRLRRAYEQSERLRVLDVTAIHELLERSNGRRGVAALRHLLAYDPTPAAATASELELRFLDLIREAGLPRPQVNVLVEGYMVDACWPWAGLVVELQGYAFHSDRQAFERDHARLAHLKLAGFEVLALTWRQVTAEPARAASLVAALLARCGSRPVPREAGR